jgi:hypothetical protein
MKSIDLNYDQSTHDWMHQAAFDHIDNNYCSPAVIGRLDMDITEKGIVSTEYDQIQLDRDMNTIEVRRQIDTRVGWRAGRIEHLCALKTQTKTSGEVVALGSFSKILSHGFVPKVCIKGKHSALKEEVCFNDRVWEKGTRFLIVKP